MTTFINKLRENYIFLIGISIGILLIVFLISLSVGSVELAPDTIFACIRGQIPEEDPTYQIFNNIRLPRSIMALFVGACLSVSGALLQAVMQNPLADPGGIGVTSGAALAAIAILILFPQFGHMLPAFAFGGAIVAVILVYIMAHKDGQIRPIRLILAGVAINSLLGGANSLISVLNADKIQSVILWINGSLAGSTWEDVSVLTKYALIGLFISLFFANTSNLMYLGDDKAISLGLNIRNARVVLSLTAAYLAGIATSLVGSIGFVGLIIPHICRLISGTDYRILLPFSLINGASFLLMADTFARTVASPVELPVGTIMSVIGAPFFLFLLRREI